jgi:hypothetical protein
VGDSVTWRLRVEDRTLALAEGVHVDVVLPPGVELAHSQADRGPGCSGPVAGRLLCDLDFLAGAAPFGNVALVTRVTQPGEHTLSAVAGFRGTDPSPADNAVTLRVATPAPTPPVTTPPARRGVVRTGRSGRDRLVGTAYADVLRGLGGQDVLLGLGGNDRLYGGRGADRITGGRGLDLLVGDAGNDVLLARDGSRDVVRCGTGRDRAIVDRRDRVVPGCEVVRRR